MAERNSNSSIDDLDLMALVSIVIYKRKKVLLITLIFSFMGLVFFFITPKEFSASTTFVPQSSESPSNSGALGGLASLAGFNLGSTTGNSDISPILYPKIVASTNFQKALINAKLHIGDKEEPITYREYYEDFYSPSIPELLKENLMGIPRAILNSFKGKIEIADVKEEDGIIQVTEEEYGHFKRLTSQLTVTPNEKEGVVSIYFKMPDPLMAAQMTKYTVDLLQEEIIRIKIKNAKEQLKFVEDRFLEREKEFEEAQIKLANFKDRNQNLSSAYVLNQLQLLETNYNFSFNVYSELAKQLEQAKLQVAKDTPVFSIIQPVTVPLEKSNIKGSVLIILFTLIGFFFSISYIIGLEFVKRLKIF